MAYRKCTTAQDDRDIVELANLGFKAEEIANAYGISMSTFFNRLRVPEHKRRDPLGRTSEERASDDAAFVERFVAHIAEHSGDTVMQVAKALGVTYRFLRERVDGTGYARIRGRWCKIVSVKPVGKGDYITLEDLLANRFSKPR